MRQLVLLLCITIIAALGVSAPRIISVSASDHSTTVAAATLQTGMKVDVGGYKLYIRCIGKGSPTVILDSNLGLGTSNWSTVLPGVSPLARVCTYDRAGLERSDKRIVHPGTSAVVVKELRTLLAKARVNGPYVLVGNTYGGEKMRLFTYLHRNDVQGLVLVDSRVVDQCARFSQLCPPPGGEEDVDLAASDMQLDTATHRKTKGSLRTLPLIVLSDGEGFFGSGADPYWDKLQGELASASSNSIHVIATGSDRLIPVMQPKLVIEAIREVVTAARSRSHTLPKCGRAFTQLRGKCVSP